MISRPHKFKKERYHCLDEDRFSSSQLGMAVCVMQHKLEDVNNEYRGDTSDETISSLLIVSLILTLFDDFLSL